ncbi:hypothetical protein KC340_g74 [Hortaea werneckii]|nr:hypothetical protein KC340_g74 [Hortaea werneckii]
MANLSIFVMAHELTFNRSCALARFSGSTLRAKCKKSLKTGVRLCSSLMAGVPLVAIRYKALSGLSVRYGGSPSIISMAMIPSDQMSIFRPYSFRVTTSGAIQYESEIGEFDAALHAEEDIVGLDIAMDDALRV